MKVLYLGEQTLREPSRQVERIDNTVQDLIRDMFITMEEDKGIGLAAPQIGKNIRIFVVKLDDGVERVFINPLIIGTSERQCSFEEGCLSIPNLYANVVRPESVTVSYQDTNGRRKTIEASGLLARVIQHEYDHLEGVLFVDRLPEKEREALISKFAQQQERAKKRKAKKRARAS